MAENGAVPALDILICVQGAAFLEQVCCPSTILQLTGTLICRIASRFISITGSSWPPTISSVGACTWRHGAENSRD